MKYKKYTIFSIIFLFFLSLLMMLKQLKSHHFFSCFTSDTYQYTSWAWQFIESLKEGIIYPRWAPLDFWGYGSPTFVIYPPLPFYMTALCYFFSNSLVFAMNFTKFLSLFISASGIFLLVKEIYHRKIALIVGIFYIVFPLSTFNNYISGSFPSRVALIWLPFVLFFILKYIKSREYKFLLYAGVCYSGLIFSHIINAYMFTFIIVAFIIYMSITKRRLKCLIGIPVILITGIAISSAYFVPFFYEKQFIDYQLEIQIFPISYFFIFPNYTSHFQAGFFWRAFYDEYFNYVVLFLIATLLILLLQKLRLNRLKINEDKNTFNKFFIAVSLFSLFLLFGPSIFLYETIPFFKYIFPVRWLIVTTFAVVLMFPSISTTLEALPISRLSRYSLIGVIFVICLLQDYKYISNACTFDKQELFPAKAVNGPSWFLPKEIDTNRIDKKGDIEEKVVITKGEGDYKVLNWGSANRIIDITASLPLILRIKTFNFPGWTASIDGIKTEIKTENDTGAILIDIPPGRHILMLQFVDIPIVYGSKIISLSSFFVIIILAIFRTKKIYGRNRELDNKTV